MWGLATVYRSDITCEVVRMLNFCYITWYIAGVGVVTSCGGSCIEDHIGMRKVDGHCC